MTSIKQLLGEKKELEGRLKVAEKLCKSSSKNVQSLKREIELLDRKIKNIRSGNLLISEHAIIQYLTRVKKVDMEAIKKEIAPEGTELVIETFGGKGKFPVGTHQIVVEQNTVKTILI